MRRLSTRGAGPRSPAAAAVAVLFLPESVAGAEARRIGCVREDPAPEASVVCAGLRLTAALRRRRGWPHVSGGGAAMLQRRGEAAEQPSGRV